MHTWVKLHTAIQNHAVMADATALQIFIYMLVSADDKGYGIVSRYKSAQFLALNSNTFYKALKRCEKKHNLVTLTVTRYYTQFSVLNWQKYQSIGNTDGNTSVTPGEHLGNTNINKERVRERDRANDTKHSVAPLTAKTGLVACTPAELKEVAKATKASLSDVRFVHQDIMDKISDGIFQKKGYGKTVYYTLGSWVRSEIRRGKFEIEDEVEIIYDE